MAKWYGRNTIEAYVDEFVKQTEDFIIGVIQEHLTEHGYHQRFEINGANIKAMVEKQIAKKVNLYIGEVPSCPVCNTRLRGYEEFIIAYCKGCGQLLKGEGVNDD